MFFAVWLWLYWKKKKKKKDPAVQLATWQENTIVPDVKFQATPTINDGLGTCLEQFNSEDYLPCSRKNTLGRDERISGCV